MDKSAREMVKMEIERQKKILKTLKKAKVKEGDSDEVIKEKLLALVANPKTECYKLVFKNEYIEDRDFLLSLYRRRRVMTAILPPSTRMSVQLDSNFMLEFLRNKLDYEMSFLGNHKSWEETEIGDILAKYPYAFIGKNFVEKVVEEYPDVKIVPLIERTLDRAFSSSYKKEDEETRNRIFKIAVSKVPLEIICKQARQYGSSYVYKVPKDLEGFNKVVSAGIECDGFHSLTKLHISQVLANKNLILKAYEKDGGEKLISYVKHDLSPVRTIYYMCHGEEHYYTTYDEEYAKVQQAIYSDKVISAILKEEIENLKTGKKKSSDRWKYIFEDYLSDKEEAEESN